MSDVGVEVGQKMRSAIKAKLTELDCYVDDELPDYIMVMIANKRTKSQMKEDLQLFLSSKTTTFVEWLHIVLKKLKEVHVTNPDVFKKPVKRKSNELTIPEEDLKKVKKEKKDEAKVSKKVKKEVKTPKSLTDDLPITANKLSEARKIVIMKQAGGDGGVDEDSFDIPLLSEISESNEEDLAMIEKRIKTVKSRLGLRMESDEEEDCLNIKPDPDDLLLNDQLKSRAQLMPDRKITVEERASNTNNNETAKEKEWLKRAVHARITFDKDKDSLDAKYAAILGKDKDKEKEGQTKKKSVLERLGKRTNEKETVEVEAKRRISVQNREKDRRKDGKKENILSRLGVMSKVSVPSKRPKTPEQELNEEEERKMTLKDVPSVVKVKPRALPAKTKQANPSLLLKAVAEAQRSVYQTPAVGTATNQATPDPKTVQPDSTALFTKRYKEKMEGKFVRKAKLLDDEKCKLKMLLTNAEASDEKKLFKSNVQSLTGLEDEAVEQTSDRKDGARLKFATDVPRPTTTNVNQKFIVTLDGIEKTKFGSGDEQKSIVKIKRTPSPIVFDKPKTTKIVPDKLPIVPTIKNKERCKYWPGCRLGEKCDFVHPSTPCKMFPNCKFEEKCLYVHPSCKFEASCTRRDCPYSHTGKNVPRMAQSNSMQKPMSQICKFFPNCVNPHCAFYHPRLCKFGVFCKNQSECNFVHSFPSKSSSGNLTWRSEHK